MKFRLSVASILFFAAHGFANYVGNPQSPDLPKIISYTEGKIYPEIDFWLNAKLEYEKEYMQNMNLEFTSAAGTKQRVQRAHFYGNFMTLTANILNRVDFYAKGGAVDPRFNFAITNAFGATSQRLTNQKTIPAWALGAKFLVFKWNRATFAVEGSYFQTDHRSFLLYNPVAPAPIHDTVSWYNWQVSAGLAWWACPLVPYIGTKFSRTIVTFNASTPSLQVPPLKMDNRREWGLFLGCTVLASQALELNFEGRFIDEQAFSATMAFKF